MKKLVAFFVLVSLLSCSISKIANYKPIKPHEPTIVSNIKDWVRNCPECLARYVEKSPDVCENLLDMTEYIEALQDYFE